MRLRNRIEIALNTRIAAIAPEASRTAWDTAGVVVLIEQARFTSAGGILAGAFERLVTVNGTVRAEIRTDDLVGMGLAEELVASLIRDPIFLVCEAVAPGMTTETARVTLTDMRVLPREGSLVQTLTLALSGEVLRRLGPAAVPSEVIVPAPLEGVGA